MKNKAVFCFLLFLLLPASIVYAEGNNHAFIRFVQLNDHYIETEIDEKYYGVVGEGEASPYYKIKKGNVTLRAGESVLQGPVHKNNFYSLVVSGHKEVFLEDFVNKEKDKAQLALYNFVDGSILTLKMKVKGEYVPVVIDIIPDHVGFRGLNPINSEFAVFNGDKIIGDVVTINLKSTRTYSVFAINDDVFISENLYK